MQATRVAPSALPGWADGDHSAALSVYHKTRHLLGPEWPDCGSIRAHFGARDSASRIFGPARADNLCGSGDAAGRMAFALNAQGRIHVLTPHRGDR